MVGARFTHEDVRGIERLEEREVADVALLGDAAQLLVLAHLDHAVEDIRVGAAHEQQVN